jgi:hypothetical protein
LLFPPGRSCTWDVEGEMVPVALEVEVEMAGLRRSCWNGRVVACRMDRNARLSEP